MITARIKATGEIVTGEVAIRALSKGEAVMVQDKPEYRRTVLPTPKAD